jgi:hypothetical protein
MNWELIAALATVGAFGLAVLGALAHVVWLLSAINSKLTRLFTDVDEAVEDFDTHAQECVEDRMRIRLAIQHINERAS